MGGAIDYYDLEFGSGNFGDSVFKVDVPEWKRTKSSLFAEFNDINESFRRVRLDTFYQQSSKKMINNVGGVWSQQDVNAFIAAGFKQPMLNAMGVIAGNNFLLQPNAKNDLDQYGLSSQFDLQLGKNHYLIAGYELSYDDLNAHSWNQGVNIMPMMKTNKKYSGYQLTNAIFASMESSLTSELTLNYGARYTWVKTHMNIVNNNTNAQSSSDGTDSKAVFNLGLLWHGLDNLILRGNFSQGYRSPILQELYIDTSMGSTSTTYANPSLKPEKSNNYELGARWAGQRFNADLAVFYNDTDDYITAVWKSALRASQYTNIANAKSYGAELTLSYKIGATGFEPYSSLSWIRRKTDDGQGFITYDSGVPNLMAKYGIRWSGEKAGLGLRADAYAVSHTKTKYKESTGSNNYVLGGYTTLNLTGGVSFGPQQQYSLDAGFYNIFNQAYREETAIYEPGRYLGVKLNARF